MALPWVARAPCGSISSPSAAQAPGRCVADAALAAGFRPCKRCQPTALTPEQQKIDKVAYACRLLEQETPLTLDAAPLGTPLVLMGTHPDSAIARRLASLGLRRGARVSLAVTNLFNARLDVRDAAGDTPISYQPAYIDPVGRSIRISFRKLF